MLEIEVEPNLKIKLLQQGFADELFLVGDKNRERLSKWLTWINLAKDVTDTLNYINYTLQNYTEGKSVETAIFLDNKLIGAIGLHSINNRNNSAELGYWLDETYLGQGYIYKCAQKLLEYGFEYLCLNKIKITAAVENENSIKVARKLEFKEDGILRSEILLNNVYHDAYVFSLLSREFKLLEKGS